MQPEIQRLLFLNPPGVFEIILVLILAAIVIYGSYRSTSRLKENKKRALLMAVHLAAFALLCLILGNPALRSESYTEEKRKLAVITDKSWSMNLPVESDGPARVEVAGKFLADNGGFLSEMEKNLQVSYFTFDRTLNESDRKESASGKAAGKDTSIKRILDEILDLHLEGSIDEAVIISDGADTDKGEDITGALEDSDIRISTVGTGSGENGKDVWIDGISVSEVSFLRYPLDVEVHVASQGYGKLNIPVTLYEGEKLLSIKEARLPADSHTGKVKFELKPESLGRKIYTVSVPPLSGELTSVNNQKSFYTDVIINKIRVLHVAGSPSWDVRFLRRAMKRNPTIELVSFFILRDPSDLVFASENELSLIPFPVNEIFGRDLGTFDVVIFQNFNFQPYGIFSFHLRSLRDYILNENGGFLMIGGNNSFDGGNYGVTPISEVLPVELDFLPDEREEPLSGKTYKPVLTEQGRGHPVMQILADPGQNEKLWNSQPALTGLNEVKGLNPFSVPLLKTPDGEPVFVVRNVKSGKVASFLSDSSWKWNFNDDTDGNVSPLFDKFWNRIFLWFVNDPELNRIRVSSDKAVYNPGDEAEITLRSYEKGVLDEEPEAVVHYPGGKEESLELGRSSENALSGEITVDEYGDYRIEVGAAGDSSDAGSYATSEIEFTAEPPEREVRGPTANQDLLREIADKTGGKYITTRDRLESINIDSSRKKTITGYRTKSLWNTPVVFIVLTALVSVDWILRRRWGLK